ncbi:hypothetical protein [Streptomyces sp. CB03911]|uniref:hypothetical protein n=1 Tax=Streptomycetaceae TaxID=2062 RepID=UPI00093A3965|nr:hypothetical protein [Streptomyces sp. CB03911]OKI26189.1 hypothetical protein A6A07_29895 [Streptomyces sp. CB03911]
MEAVLASLIAVAGTLLGSLVTFVVQRRTSARAEVFARSQQLRQDRLTTYSTYAGAITTLRQQTVALWFHLQEVPDGPETRQAFTECDRLGAAAENAQLRVRILAEDPTLVALAVATFDAIGPIRSASTRTELAEREQELQNTLDAFIAAAATHIH